MEAGMMAKEYEIQDVRLTGVSMSHLDVMDGDGKPADPLRHVSVNVAWGAKGVGWGEIRIVDEGSAGIKLYTECMSKDFVKAVLCALVDKATTD